MLPSAETRDPCHSRFVVCNSLVEGLRDLAPIAVPLRSRTQRGAASRLTMCLGGGARRSPLDRFHNRSSTVSAPVVARCERDPVPTPSLSEDALASRADY